MHSGQGSAFTNTEKSPCLRDLQDDVPIQRFSLGIPRPGIFRTNTAEWVHIDQ